MFNMTNNMKLTLIRTDKQNRLYLTAKTLEQLAEQVKSGTQRQTVCELRREIPFMSGFGTPFPKLARLHRVYPAAEWQRDGRGELAMSRFNGVVLLSIGGLADDARLQAAKRAVEGLPSTVLAVAGASGRTLKVLVAVAAADGRTPSTEEQADALYRAAYAYAARVYGGVTGVDIVPTAAVGVRDSFRMTFDAAPYVNPAAVPMVVTADGMAIGGGGSTATEPGVGEPDYGKYDATEYLYRRVADDVYSALDNDGEWHQSPYREEAATAEIAHRLCRLGVGEEDAVRHLHVHLWSRAKKDHIRGIVASAYGAAQRRKAAADPQLAEVAASAKVRRSTLALVDFLTKRYRLRYNTVMGYAEYRPNTVEYHPWLPVDERVANDLAIEARAEGFDVWDKDIKRFLNSSYAPHYSPVDDYLQQCRGTWDGRDRIGELARTVPTQNPLWESWFRRWFLAMVAQWRSTVYSRYGNASAPLLISKQGWNKSTFCQSLLPPDLQWGYTSTAKPSEEKQLLLTMSQMLLVNLDEFNKISPQVQQGFLKNVLSLPSVKARRPYGRHVEVMPRLCSFIATTNQTDVLADPSGSRRFLAVELTGPIDVSHAPNHRQLFAQALDALENGAPTWFDEAETQQIMESNRRFQLNTPASLFFADLYRPAAREDEPGAQWLSATTLYQAVRSVAGSGLKANGVVGFGRLLSGVSGLQRRTTYRGTEYLVVKSS